MSHPQDWMDRFPGSDGRHRDQARDQARDEARDEARDDAQVLREIDETERSLEQHHDSPPARSSTTLTDLRRRRRQESAEEIVRAAQHLPPAERVLIESVFRDGRRVSDMAKLIASPGRHTIPSPPSRRRAQSLLTNPGQTSPPSTAPSHADPARDRDQDEHEARALRSRVRRVVRRMMTPEYQAVARWFAIEKLSPGSANKATSLAHPTTPNGPGGALRRRVAVSCFLHGLSIREAARQLGLSLHTVRRHRDAIAAMAAMSIKPPHLRPASAPAASRRPEWRSTEPRS